MDQAQKTGGRAWWGEIVWHARASILIFVLSAAALTLPAQVQDMLAGLADFEDFSVESWWHALGFHFAMILVAVALWYWGRAVLLAWYRLPDSPVGRARLAGQIETPQSVAAERARTLLAFAIVPRAMALGIALVDVIACARSDKWLQAVLAVLWGLGLYWLLQHRLEIQARLGIGRADATAPRAEGSNWFGRFWQRLLELFDYAPIGRWIAVLFMTLAAGLFVLSAATAFVPHAIAWKTYLAHLLPGPSVAMFLFGMAVAPLTAITYGVDRAGSALVLFGRRLQLRFVPVLLILLALMGYGATMVNLHALRVVDDPNAMTPAQRASLATLFKSWAATCEPGTGPVQPIVVAVSGGASRAAMWAARVLDVVDDSVRKSGTRSASIFAVSSVSGGSFGAAAYESMRAGLSNARAGKTLGNCALPAAHADARAQAEVEALRADAIGPALAGMLLGDAPRALAAYVANPALKAYRYFVPAGPKDDQIGLFRGNDRAEALEGAFEHNWRADGIGTIDAVQAPPLDLGTAYLSLFYRDAKTPRGDVPLWIANGTDVQTGDRLITVPFDLNGEKFCTAKKTADQAMAGAWYGADPAASKAARLKALAACGPNAAYFWYVMGPFLSSFDVLGLIKTDIPISTAIDNTSRFPFLSPSGELTPTVRPDPNAKKDTDAQIIDGGYFENEGIVTAMEIARWLRTYGPGLIGRPVYPIVVQATADADPGKKERDIPRCGNARPVNPDVSGVESRASQFLVPMIGLTSVRGGHSHAFLQEALENFCDEGGQQAFFHFYLYDAPDFDVPLNWSLSEEVADFIWTDAMAMCGNEADRRNLVATLKLDPTSWMPKRERPRRTGRGLYTCTDAPVQVTIPDLPMLKGGDVVE